MRIQGNISPIVVSMETYPPKPGYVEIRLRENIKEIIVEEVTLYEYDEYRFILKYYHGLQNDIEANISDWLATGRALEINEQSSEVHDLRATANEYNTLTLDIDAAYNEGVNSI